MTNDLISISPIALPNKVPATLPEPRFRLGQHVGWGNVPSQDFGRILGIVFAAEGSVRAEGYHYAIALAPNSPSYIDGILTDWGFEDDLTLMPVQALQELS